jgi:hypothetical protein
MKYQTPAALDRANDINRNAAILPLSAFSRDWWQKILTYGFLRVGSL